MDSDSVERIERALRKSEERFRRAVEYAPNAIIMTNGAGRIEMVNAQAERLFGYSRSELLGQQVEVLVPSRFAGAPGIGRLHRERSRPMGAGRDLFGPKDQTFRWKSASIPSRGGRDDGVAPHRIPTASAKRSDRAALKKRICYTRDPQRVKNTQSSNTVSLQSANVRDEVALASARKPRNACCRLAHPPTFTSQDFAASTSPPFRFRGCRP
jgi:PAS domain-containing protein